MTESVALYKKTMNQLRSNVRAYHNNMSNRYVKLMEAEKLLSYCHPLDREGLRHDLENAEKLRVKEYIAEKKESS